ncbi:hypothetical protein BD410DRAFT_841941 [Rickenella mellea]|uniref:Uncharacterized protein n=1 Tax=Rickenella mellea TaxID=50990 RepID=A0A4Y7PXG1_9AGAM|nr:hypothetical protein BD410DRAFT_841941 [Rickenella mellea]
MPPTDRHHQEETGPANAPPLAPATSPTVGSTGQSGPPPDASGDRARATTDPQGTVAPPTSRRGAKIARRIFSMGIGGGRSTMSAAGTCERPDFRDAFAVDKLL